MLLDSPEDEYQVCILSSGKDYLYQKIYFYL